MDLEKVIDLCRKNDPQGQKLLYERFINPMARLSTRYIEDDEEAADALIEGFMKVFDSLKKFEYRNDKFLEAWIKKIIINQCLGILRKKRKIIKARDEMITREVHDQESEIAAYEIIDLIRLLPKGYRVIFNLAVIDGYSHKEIAEILGISESTSRSQLTRARHLLKNILRKNGWN
ncbi:MAG: sigma-70 family RNA polymerase sigma factor [Bacteroidota bacterium]